jgi:hypothetical protein
VIQPLTIILTQRVLLVLSLLIVNIDNVPAAQYDTVFKAAGVDALSFAPESSPLQASAWPTLGSMIDSGKRLVTFLDNQADPTVAPYLIDGIYFSFPSFVYF